MRNLTSLRRNTNRSLVPFCISAFWNSSASWSRLINTTTQSFEVFLAFVVVLLMACRWASTLGLLSTQPGTMQLHSSCRLGRRSFLMSVNTSCGLLRDVMKIGFELSTYHPSPAGYTSHSIQMCSMCRFSVWSY